MTTRRQLDDAQMMVDKLIRQSYAQFLRDYFLNHHQWQFFRSKGMCAHGKAQKMRAEFYEIGLFSPHGFSSIISQDRESGSYYYDGVARQGDCRQRGC